MPLAMRSTCHNDELFKNKQNERGGEVYLVKGRRREGQ